MLRPELELDGQWHRVEFTSLGYVLRPEPSKDLHVNKVQFTSLGYVLRPEPNNVVMARIP